MAHACVRWAEAEGIEAEVALDKFVMMVMAGLEETKEVSGVLVALTKIVVQSQSNMFLVIVTNFMIPHNPLVKKIPYSRVCHLEPKIIDRSTQEMLNVQAR